MMKLAARAWWIVRLLGGAVAAWWNDNLLRLGASLAYYTLFAVAPILIVAVAVAGAAFGEDAVRGEVAAELQGLLGPDAASAVEALLKGARRPDGSVLAFGLGLLATMLAAGGVFLELQAALNIVWRVPPHPGVRIREYLWNRAQAFGVVLAIGFLLLVSLALGAALSAVIAWFGARMPTLAAGLGVLNMALALGLNAVLFALLFKVLPDVPLGYRTVAAGGLMTAALFVVGRTLIGLYIGQAGTASSYGAVGSVAVLLLWVYYSSQIVLIGAEFTRLYAVATSATRADQAIRAPGAATP
jgi:membrane protein